MPQILRQDSGIRTHHNGRLVCDPPLQSSIRPLCNPLIHTSGISWYRRAVFSHLIAGKAAYLNFQRSVVTFAVLTLFIPAVSLYSHIRASVSYILKRASRNHLTYSFSISSFVSLSIPSVQLFKTSQRNCVIRIKRFSVRTFVASSRWIDFLKIRTAPGLGYVSSIFMRYFTTWSFVAMITYTLSMYIKPPTNQPLRSIV